MKVFDSVVPETSRVADACLNPSYCYLDWHFAVLDVFDVTEPFLLELVPFADAESGHKAGKYCPVSCVLALAVEPFDFVGFDGWCVFLAPDLLCSLALCAEAE